MNGLGSDGKATAFDATIALTSATAGVGCLDVDGSGNVYFGTGTDAAGSSAFGFDSVLGTTRKNCASVTSTPSLNTWYPTGTAAFSTYMQAVLVDGSNVYWCGASSGSPSRSAGCMTTSAVDQTWHPEVAGSGQPPMCIGSDGAGVIWLGGSFTNALSGNFTRMHIAKFKDATVTPTALAW